MSKTSEILFAFVRDMIYFPKKATLNLDNIDEEYKDLAQGLIFLHECLIEVKELAENLGRGHLDVPSPDPRNVLAFPLKALHSSLKHIVWQARQIEKGDLNQTVDALGEFSEVFNDMRDKLKKSREALEAQAYREPLTMLFNRRYIMEALEKMVKGKKHFSVCFVDLDNLKYINDTFGHEHGDKFIIGVGDALKNDFPQSVLARIGGDEFLMLLPEMSESETEKTILKASSKVEHFSKRTDGKVRKALSYGVVEVFADNTLSESEILAEADAKMYAVKLKHKAEFQDEIRK